KLGAYFSLPNVEKLSPMAADSRYWCPKVRCQRDLYVIGHVPDYKIGNNMRKEIEKKGHPLRLALRAAMYERSHGTSYVAKQVGIGQSYLSELMRGDKPMEQVSDKHLRAFAAYLGVPSVAGFILAGRLDASDFLEVMPSLEERLEKTLKLVCASPSAAE